MRHKYAKLWRCEQERREPGGAGWRSPADGLRDKYAEAGAGSERGAAERGKQPAEGFKKQTVLM